MSVISPNLRKPKLQSRPLSNNNKRKSMLKKEEVSLIKSKLDHTPLFTMIFQKIRDKILMLKLITMLSLWLSKLKKIKPAEQSFFSNVS
jgi:hypothetical protein